MLMPLKIYKTKSKNIHILIEYVRNLDYVDFIEVYRTNVDVEKYKNHEYIYVCLWNDNEFKLEVINYNGLPEINFDRIIKFKKLV